MSSEKARLRYPDPDRKHYFNDEDYTAAIRRIVIKRDGYDKVNKLGVSAKSESTVKSYGLAIQRICGIGNGHSRAPRPVIIEGVEYKSATHASKVLYLSKTTVFNRVNSGMYPNWNFKVADEDSDED